MPSIVDMSLIDDMMEITDEDAKKYMEILAKEEGILAGYSSGAVLAGTIKYLKTNKYVDSYRMGTFGEGEMGVTIVTLKIK